MKRVLISWIGGNDLKSQNSDQLGPVGATLKAQSFDELVLLYNYPKKQVSPYLAWLQQQTKAAIQSHYVALSSPIDFGEIYQAANQYLNQLSQAASTQINILLSPGTPAMQAVWILLGKTQYSVVFYQATLEQGVQQVEIPFDISAEFIPSLAARTDKQLTRLSAGEVPIDAAFDDILTQNPKMKTLKSQASLMAQREIPVLIYGETGTGKELFATAIHNASQRKAAPLVAVNCGAIPPELIDSTLFGHVKGAFTGAINDKKGLFQEADGGTIFLDEFGELPKEAQVRLLRVLQSGEVTPVGSTTSKHVNVRLIAATNRNLIEEVVEGRFREDLFYRVAVGVLHLPPLRERTGDIKLLAEALLQKINLEAASQPGYKQKKISVKAKNLILLQQWQGNIRELYSCLLRASLWSQQPEITEADIQASLFQMPGKGQGILAREFDKDFDIQEVIDEVARHYVRRALAESGDNKTRAAELLGLSSYQTLKNWMDKYKVN